MLQKFKITSCVFILCLFGLTLITVSPIFAQVGMGSVHKPLSPDRPTQRVAPSLTTEDEGVRVKRRKNDISLRYNDNTPPKADPRRQQGGFAGDGFGMTDDMRKEMELLEHNTESTKALPRVRTSP